MHTLSRIAVICVFAAAAAAHAAGDNSFAIRDVRVFDGRRTIARTTVVVQNGRIAAMGPGISIPKEIEAIDGSAKTLIPGLIDAHVHIFPGARADALRFGVTTELDMFDVGNDLAAWKHQRRSLAQTQEADAWAAGLGVTVPGGAPLQQLPPEMKLPTLADAEQAKAFVDARVAEGSDYIKIFIEDLSEYGGSKRLPTLSKGAVCAVIAAAHADGKMAIAHAQAEDAAREAINCGADGLAHVFPDRAADPAFLALARRRQIFVIATDSVWAGVSAAGLAQKLAVDARVAPLLSASQKSTLLATDPKAVASFFPMALANTEKIFAAGVTLLAGTDAGNPATAHGVSLHEEMKIFVQAGLKPEQALAAATSLPAKTFKLGDRGTIQLGYRADLVLIDGDPTQSIDDSLSIARIWKNGYAVNRTPPKK